MALTTGLPLVSVPTTYAGSEATSVWGLTDATGKRTGKDPRVLPRAIVYDAELTLSLPVGMSVASGLNALAHCVDSLWAPGANPINRAMALEGARHLVHAVPALKESARSTPAREQMLLGAYLAGVSFSAAGAGLHHKICHVLGGTLDLPHAQTHAVILPHVLAFNAPYVPDVDAALHEIWGGEDATSGLVALIRSLDGPASLSELGMAPEQIDDVVTAIVEQAGSLGNPAPVDETAVRRLLLHAVTGDTDR